MNVPYDIQVVRTTAFHGGAKPDESTFDVDFGTAMGDCLTADQLRVLIRAACRALRESGMDMNEILSENEKD